MVLILSFKYECSLYNLARFCQLRKVIFRKFYHRWRPIRKMCLEQKTVGGLLDFPTVRFKQTKPMMSPKSQIQHWFYDTSCLNMEIHWNKQIFMFSVIVKINMQEDLSWQLSAFLEFWAYLLLFIKCFAWLVYWIIRNHWGRDCMSQNLNPCLPHGI